MVNKHRLVVPFGPAKPGDWPSAFGSPASADPVVVDGRSGSADRAARGFPIGCAAGRMINNILSATALLALTGCFEDQARTVAWCSLEAWRAYPSAHDGEQTKQYIKTCMQSAEYYYVQYHSEVCRNVKYDEGNAFCYVPMGRMAKFFYDAELRIIGPPRPALSDFFGSLGSQTQ